MKALHCIALHCIALHCIALHCIALHCIALHCIALHCIVVLSSLNLLMVVFNHNFVLNSISIAFSCIFCYVKAGQMYQVTNGIKFQTNPILKQ